ncbi:hypothetical protein R6Q59_025340 [Mikania micrantha]
MNFLPQICGYEGTQGPKREVFYKLIIKNVEEPILVVYTPTFVSISWDCEIFVVRQFNGWIWNLDILGSGYTYIPLRVIWTFFGTYLSHGTMLLVFCSHPTIYRASTVTAYNRPPPALFSPPPPPAGRPPPPGTTDIRSPAIAPDNASGLNLDSPW